MRGWPALVVGLCVALAGARASATPPPTPAPSVPSEPAPTLEWRAEWARYGRLDLGLTLAGAGLAITAVAIGPERDTPRTLRWPLDEQVRAELRPSSFYAQQAARDVSDQLLALNVSYPFFVDALGLAAHHHQAPAVARELVALDLEAFALTLGVQQAFANYVSRERPHGRTCGTDELPAGTAACALNDRYRSYFSGHTSLSFTAATLTCTHHAHLPLHGGRAEWLPCAVLLGTASTTGLLRIVGDRHYLSDVVTGAAVGGFIGWIVPYAHYRRGRRRDIESRALQWSVAPGPGGVQVVGSF